MTHTNPRRPPICNSVLHRVAGGTDKAEYECPRCGTFQMTGTAEAVVRAALDISQTGGSPHAHARVAAFSHAVRLEFEDVRQSSARITSKIAGPVAPTAKRRSYTPDQERIVE